MRAVILSVIATTSVVDCQADVPASADLVLRDGIIATMEASQPYAQALAVRAGKFVAVGTNREIEACIGRKTKVIDLTGRFVMPGFVEGHGHLTGVGEALRTLNLRNDRNWQEIVARVAEAANRTDPGQWILGVGWHQEHWDQPPLGGVRGYPTHAQISHATPLHPVLLTHRTGHMCFANAQAMQRAGITNATPDPNGGQILRDERGDAIGIFRETAQDLIQAAYARDLRRRSANERRRDARHEIELAVAECLRLGVTSFHDAGSSFETIALLREFAERGELTVRLWVMTNEDNSQLRAQLPKVAGMRHTDHLVLGGIKRMIDGALGSHGAWLLHPYDDLPSSTGLQVQPIADIEDTARIALEHRLQLCVHAIGDRANREVLNLFERVFAANPEHKDLRWRIEHAQHLDPSDIPRFAKLGVIASMQGVHATSDGPFVVTRLGHRRAEQGAYVWQSLLRDGTRVINGTDAPVEDLDPLVCFRASVTRQMSDGRRFFSKQVMTREQALRSYTIDGAYAAFQDKQLGSVAVGKLADIVVVSRNLLSCNEVDLRSAQIDMTIVGGHVRYARR